MNPSSVPDPILGEARLQALSACGVFDGRPDASIDRCVRIAVQALRAPVVLVSLVDERRQCVDNLLGNAVRFCRTAIRVSVGHVDDDVEIAVEDDGAGLASEDYARAWEWGARIHGHSGQSRGGQGLAITRQLVIACGGAVAAGPSELGGARFVLRLSRFAGC